MPTSLTDCEGGNPVSVPGVSKHAVSFPCGLIFERDIVIRVFVLFLPFTVDVADYNPKEASMFFINPRPTLKNFRLNNHVISTSQERNILSCMNACLALHDCVSFNFRTKRGNAGHVCQLNDAIVEEAESDFTYVNYFIYFQRDSYRQH